MFYEVPDWYYENIGTILNIAASRYRTIFKDKNGVFEFEVDDSKGLSETLNKIKKNITKINKDREEGITEEIIEYTQVG
jgi:hypothetical protein